MFESEERRIVRRIKDFIKDGEPPKHIYIMLRNGRILDIDSYFKMVSVGKIGYQDTYVYIRTYQTKYKADFYYPFLKFYDDLLFAYLSRLGFHIAPATGLKYVADAERYGDYLSIELADLDIVVSNTNLRKIIIQVLGKKLISGGKELTEEEYFKIRGMYKSQKLFAGYNFDEAWRIIHDYYDKGNKSLAREVARITFDYYRIFQPYTVCYDMNSLKEIDCLSINLD